MKQATKDAQWKTGQKVTGIYCGQTFDGVISGETRATPDYRNIQFWIDLDYPIVVFGSERDSVIVTTNSDDTLYFV